MGVILEDKVYLQNDIDFEMAIIFKVVWLVL